MPKNVHLYTQYEIDTILQMFPNHTSKQIAEKLGLNMKNIDNKIRAMRKQGFELKKCADYEYFYFKKGHNGGNQFAKGSIPFNKGIKGIIKKHSTSFKKGNIPHNIMPIGSFKKSGDYQYIKIGMPNTWEAHQRHIYQKHHSVILQKNDMIVFIDGNKLNFAIENLLRITRTENIAKNSIQNLPAELKKSIFLVTKIKRILNEKQNNRP